MNEQNEPELENDPDALPDDEQAPEVGTSDLPDADESIDDAEQDDDFPADDPDSVIEPLPDIDAALASVDSLADVLAEQEAAERAEQERVAAEQHAVAEAQRAAEEEAERRASHYYPRPPRVGMERGQMTSVAAALSLIGVGAWLTLTLTTTGEFPEPGLFALIVGTALGVMMLAYWLTSERWGRGSLFGGLTLLTSGGIIFFVLQENGLGIDGWPLLIIAPGVALLLTALLSQPFSGRILFAGVLFVLAGIIGLAVTTQTFDTSQRDTALNIWPIVIGVALFLLIVPAILTRR